MTRRKAIESLGHEAIFPKLAQVCILDNDWRDTDRVIGQKSLENKLAKVFVPKKFVPKNRTDQTCMLKLLTDFLKINRKQ